MRIWITAIGLVALILLVFAFGFSRYADFNRAGIMGSKGRVANGSKFGIEVGEHYSKSESLMASLGFENVQLTKDNSCHGYDYQDDMEPHLWFDNSWRKGTICVVTSSGKVKYVSWTYGMGFP